MTWRFFKDRWDWFWWAQYLAFSALLFPDNVAKVAADFVWCERWRESQGIGARDKLKRLVKEQRERYENR